MSEDFRHELNQAWRMQRAREAVEAYRDAVDQLTHDFCRELRPPCRDCDKWPCECRD